MSALNRFMPAILLSYVAGVNCELTPEQCNDLSKFSSRLESEIIFLQTELNKKKWIPCKERLPEDRKRVLVSIANRDIAIANHLQSVPQWSTDHGIYYHGDSYQLVTHWKPMPELPEEIE